MQKLANLIHKLYLWTKTPEALVRCTPIAVAYDRDSKIPCSSPSDTSSSPSLCGSPRWSRAQLVNEINLVGSNSVLMPIFRLCLRGTRALVSPTRCDRVYAKLRRCCRALIMAQTTLNIYASDQIFKCVWFISKAYCRRIHIKIPTATSRAWPARSWVPWSEWFVGTLVRGMSPWALRIIWTYSYILNAGAGNGNGNPYGLAAITGVILVPFVFLRIFAPPQYLSAVIMAGVRSRHANPLDHVSRADDICACGHLRTRGWLLLD